MPIKIGNPIPGTFPKNREVAEHLQLVAYALALDGAGHFKVKAFETAAESIMLFTEDISIVDLKRISGVGESTAVVVRDFLATGTSARLRDLATRHPVEALTMCRVDSVGPRTAIKLYEEMGIKNFDELVAAAQQGKLKDRLRDAVLFAAKKARIPYAQAKELAETCIYALKVSAPVFTYQFCGSLRRKSVDSKDVDIVGCYRTDRERDLTLDAFGQLTGATLINRGENRSSIRYDYNGITMQVDLWLVPPESWGSALNYATGSTAHNIALRTKARKMNMLINEYGIWKLDEAENPVEQLGGSDEGDLYKLLGIPYVEPENRTGEIPGL